MRVLLSAIAIIVLVSGCNTTGRMAVEPIAPPEPIEVNTKDLAPFTLAAVVSGLRFGAVIGHYPANGVEGVDASLCNYSYRGDNVIEWSGSSREYMDDTGTLQDVFFNVMQGRGYDVVGDPSNLFNRKDELNRAEYQIGARVVDLSGNFCEDHDFWYGYPMGKFSGEMRSSIEWTIYNVTTREDVAKITTEGYKKVIKPSRNGKIDAFVGAFSGAADALASNKEFIQALSKSNQSILTEVAVPVADEVLLLPRIPLSTETFQSQAGYLLNSVVTIRAGGGHGSGFIISKDGYVLTNEHVINGTSEVLVRFSNGVEVAAQVLRSHKGRDIALLKLPLNGLPAIPINEKIPEVAATVYAIGSPKDEDLQSTVKDGLVSIVRDAKFTGVSMPYIQASIDVAKGNSGGPMLDFYGNVVGLTDIGLGENNLNFFIPIQSGLEFLNIRLVSNAEGS